MHDETEHLLQINGGFYETSGTFRGESVGALKIEREWISEPEQGRGVVAFKTVDGKIETSIDRIALQHRILLPNDMSIELMALIVVDNETNCCYIAQTSILLP